MSVIAPFKTKYTIAPMVQIARSIELNMVANTRLYSLPSRVSVDIMNGYINKTAKENSKMLVTGFFCPATIIYKAKPIPIKAHVIYAGIFAKFAFLNLSRRPVHNPQLRGMIERMEDQKPTVLMLRANAPPLNTNVMSKMDIKNINAAIIIIITGSFFSFFSTGILTIFIFIPFRYS